MAEVFVKAPHRAGCDGTLMRKDPTGGHLFVDKIGRIGNGGLIAYDYICTWSLRSHCDARVLVTESAVRSLAMGALTKAAER